MRVLVSIIFLFFCACANQSNDGLTLSRPLSLKDTTIILKDSLGAITVTIPKRFDTSFEWMHYSDDGNGQEKYRFQSKLLPVKKESGWVWFDPVDSIDQLTLVHYEHLRLEDTTDNAIRQAHLKSLADVKLKPWMRNLIYDSIEKIDHKLFSVIAAENYDSLKKLYHKYFEAETFLKGNIIKFEFKLVTKNNDSITANFIEDTKKLIRQTRINGL